MGPGDWITNKLTGAESSKTAAARPRNKAESKYEARKNTTRNPGSRAEECTACTEKHPPHDMCRVPCKHYYCTDCLAYMFKAATEQESQYPPKCCKQVIHLKEARQFLDQEVLNQYEKKKVEWDTKNRTYCARAGCHMFIPQSSLGTKQVICPNCGKETCSLCKGRGHKGKRCSDNEALKKTLELLKAKGWRRCPECGEGIELTKGCDHMQCRCGRDFCYKCGVAYGQYAETGNWGCKCSGVQHFALGGINILNGMHIYQQQGRRNQTTETQYIQQGFQPHVPQNHYNHQRSEPSFQQTPPAFETRHQMNQFPPRIGERALLTALELQGQARVNIPYIVHAQQQSGRRQQRL